jgi:hypothetical protein
MNQPYHLYGILHGAELSEEQREWLIGKLEFDWKLFPGPYLIKGKGFCDDGTIRLGLVSYEGEVQQWFDRSDKIDNFVKTNFKIKQ